MKLFDWLLKEDLTDPLDIDALIIAAKDGRKLGAMEGYKSDGLHVIGTCGECKHWALKDIPIPDLGPLNEMTGEYPSCGNCSARNGDSLYDSGDGCIHFEAKGEK